MAKLNWLDDQTAVIDGVEFVASPPGSGRFNSSASRFCLVKRRDLVQAHVDFLLAHRPSVIVELGVYQGGSTALMALLTNPTRLLALEKSTERIRGLDEFIEERKMHGQVEVVYGLDQANTEDLLDRLNDYVGAHAVDLVVDDASHSLDPTRASFNALFPRLRPGGVYIIEDWSWAHVGLGMSRPKEVPLTALVFELIMALPSAPGLIADIAVNRDWVAVTRGVAAVAEGDFNISDAYSERARHLVRPLSGNGA